MSQQTWNLTGDPFVDNGIWAITVLAGKTDPHELRKEDVSVAIDDLQDLLFDGGIESTLRMLWVNHPVYQTSYSPDQRRLVVKNILEDLLNWSAKAPLGNVCPVCGIDQAAPMIRTKAKDGKQREMTATRTYVPMLGSGKMVNFFSQGSRGVRLCAKCLLATQFLPFMVWKSKNLILAHSTSPEVMKVIAKGQIDTLDRSSALRDLASFSGLATRTQNAIYNIVVKTIQRLTILELSPNLTFYDFTNYGQSPNVEGIYFFPNPAFRFLNEINHLNAWNDWKKVVLRGFPKWALKSKRKSESKQIIEELAFRSRPNRVYDNLLANRSIIPYFVDIKRRTAYGTWKLLSHYLKEVRDFDAAN